MEEQLLMILGTATERQQLKWRPVSYQERGDEEVEISGAQRDEIVSWMHQLHLKFRFYPETLMLGVAILDRFLQSVKVRPKYLKCIGITCFYLAAKTCEEDEVVPATSELVEESECGRTISEVLRMERVVLDKLHWDLNLPTAQQFLHVYHAMLMSKMPHLLDGSGVTPSRQLSELTNKLVICVSQHDNLSIPPSVMAVGLLSLELEECTPHWLPASMWLQSLAGPKQVHLIDCREKLSCCLNLPAESSIRVKRAPAVLKRSIVNTVPNSGGATKRKVAQMEVDEDDNIYEGIKRLYNEEGEQVLTALSCAREMMGEDVTAIRTLATVN